MFDGLVHALLYLGVACQLVCVVGVLAMRGPFDRLHYAAAGSTLGPVLIGAALVLRETVRPHGVLEMSSGGTDALAACALIFVLGPAATIQLARAARQIERGEVAARPEETVTEARS
ncbi:MAG: monovalent cation/H(+) antiporter subunit G [Gaiellaceae bacterium]